MRLRNIGEHIQAQHSLDERIVFVKTYIAQASISRQHVDNEQQRDASVGKDGGGSQMLKAGFQARQKLKVLEELPKDNQSGEGGETLVFEGESGD